jgi:vacuolar-type H+-ATPase subunit F/Vma7
MNPIESVANEVRKRAPAAIIELEDKIQEAINVILEENQGQEEPKPVVVSIPISVKWNIDEGSVEITTSVSVKHRVKDSIKLQDPNQPELVDRDGNPLPQSVAKPLRQIRGAILESKVNHIRGEGGAE